MKVVVQSSSLIFTVLSIVFNVPITRVKQKPAVREAPHPQPKPAA